MTEITPITASGQTSTGSVAQQAASESSGTISDFNDFLTLLTAQLQNQDPLSPLDSTQFVEQLASFSQVEQAVNTNDKLDALIAQNSGDELTELAAWVGREVQATGLDFAFDGSALRIDVPKEPDARTATVVIKDDQGREVANLTAPVEGGEVVWDGTQTDGGKAAAGTYSIEFSYAKGAPGTDEATTVTREAQGSGQVKEVRIENGEPVLVLDGGRRASPSEVTAVLEPGGAAAAAQSAVDSVSGAVDAVDEAVDAVAGS